MRQDHNSAPGARSIRKILLTFCVTFATFCVHAETCGHVEFDELKRLDGTDLVTIRCEYRGAQKIAPAAVAARCDAEVTQMDRLIARRFSMHSTGDELTARVDKICADRKAPAL